MGLFANANGFPVHKMNWLVNLIFTVLGDGVAVKIGQWYNWVTHNSMLYVLLSEGPGNEKTKHAVVLFLVSWLPWVNTHLRRVQRDAYPFGGVWGNVPFFGGEVRRAVQLCCRSDESRRHIAKIPIHMEPPSQGGDSFLFLFVFVLSEHVKWEGNKS